MVASVEKLGTERAFVDIYIERNKYWVEPVKLSEGQRIVYCCYLIYR